MWSRFIAQGIKYLLAKFKAQSSELQPLPKSRPGMTGACNLITWEAEIRGPQGQVAVKLAGISEIQV